MYLLILLLLAAHCMANKYSPVHGTEMNKTSQLVSLDERGFVWNCAESLNQDIMGVYNETRLCIFFMDKLKT